MQLICHCAFGVAAQHALLQSSLFLCSETCLSLLVLGARQYNQNTSLSQHWVYIARRGKLLSSVAGLADGWSAACWHALAKV